MYIVIALIVITITLLSLKATFLVVKNTYLETHQKWLQCLLIWLVPLIGSLLVLTISDDKLANGKFKEFRSLEENGLDGLNPEHFYTGMNEVDSNGDHL